MTTYSQTRPAKCCGSPVLLFREGAWQCLNCQLYDAIHLTRDWDEQRRLLALMESMRAERRVRA